MIRLLISNSAKYCTFYVALFVLVIIQTTSAAADPKLAEAIKICAEDTNPKAREACYSAIKSLAETSTKGDQPDASIAEILKLIKNAQERAQKAEELQKEALEKKKTLKTGLWDTHESASPIDDSKRVVLSLQADDHDLSLFSERARVFIRCDENKTSFYVSLGTTIGSFTDHDRHEITYRIGHEPAETKQWYPSTNRSAIGLWSGTEAIPFIRRLVQHEKFVVRTAKFDGGEITKIFSIKGLKYAIQPVAEACNWKQFDLKKTLSGSKNIKPTMQSVLKTLEDLKRQAPSKEEETLEKKKAEPEPSFDVTEIQKAVNHQRPRPYDADRPLSISEIDVVRRQIMRCWNPPAGAKDARDMAVEVRVVINPDGKVREAHVVTTDRMISDPFFKAMAESARRAVLNPQCQPFKLPPDRYQIWQTMMLNFDPREML